MLQGLGRDDVGPYPGDQGDGEAGEEAKPAGRALGIALGDLQEVVPEADGPEA